MDQVAKGMSKAGQQSGAGRREEGLIQRISRSLQGVKDNILGFLRGHRPAQQTIRR
jgi:hypothetical protein